MVRWFKFQAFFPLFELFSRDRHKKDLSLVRIVISVYNLYEGILLIFADQRNAKINELAVLQIELDNHFCQMEIFEKAKLIASFDGKQHPHDLFLIEPILI